MKKRNLYIIEGAEHTGKTSHALYLDFKTLHMPITNITSGREYLQYLKGLYQKFLKASEYPNNIIMDKSYISEVIDNPNITSKYRMAIIDWLMQEFKEIKLILMLPPIEKVLYSYKTIKGELKQDFLISFVKEYIEYEKLALLFQLDKKNIIEYEYAIPILSCDNFKYEVIRDWTTNIFYDPEEWDRYRLS